MRAHAIFRNNKIQKVVVGKPKHAEEEMKVLKKAHALQMKMLPEGDLYNDGYTWAIETVDAVIYQG